MNRIDEIRAQYESMKYCPADMKRPCDIVDNIPHLLSEVERLTAELEQYRQAKAKLSINRIVYAVIKCGDITMLFDNDYEHGTGAVECPFENQCNLKECDDEQSQILETTVSGILINEDGLTFWLKDVGYGGLSYSEHDIGKTVFFSREEAEKAQEGNAK